VGVKTEIQHLNSIEDDPQRRKPDISRAKKVLNWEPRISLKNGLQMTINYFRKELLASRQLEEIQMTSINNKL
jgi:UDP-glucuronate decarboxylase